MNEDNLFWLDIDGELKECRVEHTHAVQLHRLREDVIYQLKRIRSCVNDVTQLNIAKYRLTKYAEQVVIGGNYVEYHPIDEKEFYRQHMCVWKLDTTLDPLIEYFKKLSRSNDAEYRSMILGSKESGFMDRWSKEQIKTAKSIVSNQRGL